MISLSMRNVQFTSKNLWISVQVVTKQYKKQLGSGTRRRGSTVATAGQPPSLLGQLPCLARGHPDWPARLSGPGCCRSVDLPSFLSELTELSARVRVLPWSTIPAEIAPLRRVTTAGIVLSCWSFARCLRSMSYPRSVDLPSFLGKLTELGAR